MQYKVIARLIGTAAGVMALASCATPGVIDNWSSIGEAADGAFKAEIYRPGIDRRGSMIFFQERKIHKIAVPARAGQYPAHKSVITTWEADCRNRTMRPVKSEWFDSSGQSVYKEDYPAARMRLEKPAPASVAEQELQSACAA